MKKTNKKIVIYMEKIVIFENCSFIESVTAANEKTISKIPIKNIQIFLEYKDIIISATLNKIAKGTSVKSLEFKMIISICLCIKYDIVTMIPNIATIISRKNKAFIFLWV